MSEQQLKQQHGFVDADPSVQDRMIVSVRGLEKQGKTHFALTAPDPIAVFSLDIGTEGVVSKFKRDGKKIIIKDLSTGGDADEGEKVWEGFKKAYSACLQDSQVKTVVIDTETELWELIRLARFGKLTQVMPYHYGPVNGEYRKVIREAYDSSKNLILLHKMKPKYVNDKRTNEYERAGFNDVGFLAQVNCQVYRDPVDEGGEFNLEILDCRQNADASGEVLSGPMASWDFLASTVLE